MSLPSGGRPPTGGVAYRCLEKDREMILPPKNLLPPADKPATDGQVIQVERLAKAK